MDNFIIDDKCWNQKVVCNDRQLKFFSSVTITLLLKNNHDYVMASKVWRDKFEKIKHIEVST